MSIQRAGPDAARSRLRTTVATIDREIARITKDGVGVDAEKLGPLNASWADLVAQLALGPEPEVRECPACRAIGIREATTCGFCWTRLEPPSGEGASSSKS